ncbi:AmmeMemoRadiSam system protein B [Candidatus Bathyarchaeota archaeon ex4484_205]|nr:MAG: AmmeMemoRadiSam system protein B [Candidatus Bathyarchaeota archaeon ex4484_205]HDN18353.1 AmmeMemoRadiSam system protein B [Candidatus Bathyarchaeota archaeon]
MYIRRAIHAGSWYPSSPHSIKSMIEKLSRPPLGPGGTPILSETPNEHLVGILVPHAGWVYSGSAALHAYVEAAKHGPRESVVMMGPNHYGIGGVVATMKNARWETPLGMLDVDDELVSKILSSSKEIEDNPDAHFREHSLEVQLPFLAYVYGPDLKIVPITMYTFTLDTALHVGDIVAEAVDQSNILLLATSDMSHYKPQEIAEEHDRKTLEAILQMNEEKVFSIAEELESLCGLGATVSLLRAAKKLGAKRAVLLKYYTSGDVTGDYSAVVGYASVAFYR